MRAPNTFIPKTTLKKNTIFCKGHLHLICGIRNTKIHVVAKNPCWSYGAVKYTLCNLAFTEYVSTIPQVVTEWAVDCQSLHFGDMLLR